MASDKTIKLTDANFEEEVKKSSGLFIVDFWAEWCGPCKVIAPILEDLAKEYDAKAKIGKLNVDENREMASNYGIHSIPTLLFFKDGKKVEEVIGALTRAALKAKIERWL
ncbi:MAG: thioredoxin [candidate division NC10 bacterium]|nr:thioredoxin [candidate division NC10 bacterium]